MNLHALLLLPCPSDLRKVCVCVLSLRMGGDYACSVDIRMIECLNSYRLRLFASTFWEEKDIECDSISGGVD